MKLRKRAAACTCTPAATNLVVYQDAVLWYHLAADPQSKACRYAELLLSVAEGISNVASKAPRPMTATGKEQRLPGIRVYIVAEPSRPDLAPMHSRRIRASHDVVHLG
jgi:hypothetical protein